jgi:GNAT superfamily N-acetyltransferase
VTPLLLEARVLREALLRNTEFRGYFPGVIGQITEAHVIYYHKNWGLDASFETQVGRELSEFVSECQEGRDGLWVATVDGVFVGSSAIDGRQAATHGARLRWYIVVSDFQRAGIGKTLLNRAVGFCKSRDYSRVYLWSFKGLKVARTLYERLGFCLCQERRVSQWGQKLTEQMFELRLKD